MAILYLGGQTLANVANFCVIFQLRCREYTVLWAYVQNKNKKCTDKNCTTSDLSLKNSWAAYSPGNSNHLEIILTELKDPGPEILWMVLCRLSVV